MIDILDIHTHTLASGHAYSTMWEMAQYAAQHGQKLLGITEHAPSMPGSCHEYYFANLRVAPREVNGMRLLHGVELNILDSSGTVDLSQEILSELDVAIASLHPPCYTPGSRTENTHAYQNAMKNPYVNVIGHPDDGRYEIDYEELVRAAKEYGVLLELNNNSLNPAGFRKDTKENDRTMLRYCMQYEVPIIIGSDAHIMTDIGNHARAHALLQEVAFPEHLVANTSVELLMKYVNYGKRERM